MARSKLTFISSLEGPFFTHDPARTFRANARVMMKRIAAEGEADVRAAYRGGEASRRPLSHGVRPSRVSGHVVGRVASVRGRPWAVTARVSVLPTNVSPAQAVAVMAAASVLEGRLHVFRRAAARMRRARALNWAELLKGLR